MAEQPSVCGGDQKGGEFRTTPPKSVRMVVLDAVHQIQATQAPGPRVPVEL